MKQQARRRRRASSSLQRLLVVVGVGVLISVFALVLWASLWSASDRHQADSLAPSIAGNGSESTARLLNKTPELAAREEPLSDEELLAELDVLSDEDFAQLLARDPLEAADAVAGLPHGTSLRDQRLSLLMKTWVREDPSAAAKWLRSLPNGTLRAEAAQEMGAAWAHHDPEAAAEWARREMLVGNVGSPSALLSVWGRKDPKAAAEWLSGVSDLPQVDLPVLAGSLAFAWAEVDPEAAAKWVHSQDDLAVRHHALINLAASWAAKDPAALAGWTAAHLTTDSPEAAGIYITLASSWADSSPRAAGNWATQLPKGEVRDSTLSAFASSLATSNPAGALQWSDTIGDREMRQETILDVYDTWLDDDLPGARAQMVTSVPNLDDRDFQHQLFALLHEKDPIFREELYDLIQPDTSTAPESEARNSTSSGNQPEIRRALPLIEDKLEVEELAK